MELGKNGSRPSVTLRGRENSDRATTACTRWAVAVISFFCLFGAGAALAAAVMVDGAAGAAMERLLDDQQMGALFKVMGLAAPAWPKGAGF